MSQIDRRFSAKKTTSSTDIIIQMITNVDLFVLFLFVESRMKNCNQLNSCPLAMYGFGKLLVLLDQQEAGSTVGQCRFFYIQLTQNEQLWPRAEYPTEHLSLQMIDCLINRNGTWN